LLTEDSRKHKEDINEDNKVTHRIIENIPPTNSGRNNTMLTSRKAGRDIQVEVIQEGETQTGN
jgi:hypothetical protein